MVRSPTPFGLGRNGSWPSRGSQLPRVPPFIFSLCCSLNDRRRAANILLKISRLFSLFLLYSEASLLPLRVTPNHFTLSSYERALRLPTTFPISGLTRLEVKPRLCRSSWRAFASTHPLMLPSTCSREVLVAWPPSSPWNLPSFTMESTLSSSCSRSDLPLSR